MSSSKRKNDISSVLINFIFNSDSIPCEVNENDINQLHVSESVETVYLIQSEQSVQHTEQYQILNILIPGPSIIDNQTTCTRPNTTTPHSPPNISAMDTCITDFCSETSALPTILKKYQIS